MTPMKAEWKDKLFLILGLLLLLGLAFSSLLYGTVSIPAGHVLRILTAWREEVPGVQEWERTIILHLRLPRVVMAVAAGSSLAAAGLIMQGLFQNPLACPSIIGVSAGASLGAVSAIFFGLAAQHVWTLPAFAFAGGVGTAFAVYRVSTSRGHTSMTTLLLAGIAFGSLNVALTSFILSLALANYEIGKEIVFWTLGGLDRQTWDQVKIALPLCLFCLLVIPSYWRALDALALGEVHASSVGIDVHRTRTLLLLAASLCTAASVAVAGTIGFVGLIVPHLLRLLLGPTHRRLVPGCIIGGAIFLLLADLLSRTLIAPEEMRLGVVTAALGAPFFLYLLLRNRETEAG